MFELAKIKGYDRGKTERLLTFVLHLMQLPEYLEAEMKSFYRKNKKVSNMATATETKPKKKEKLSDDAKFIRDLSYEFAYGMSYDELYDTVHREASEKISVIAAEQAKVMAAEQAKVMAAEQAKVMAAEQAKIITNMFKKTGWSAEKIADIIGFPLDIVQKVVDKLKG